MNNDEKAGDSNDGITTSNKDFGFGSEGSSKYKQVYFVRAYLKDEPHLLFTWSKNGEKFQTKQQKLKGKLVKIEKDSYEYEGEMIETLKFHLEWKDDLFIWGTAYTGVARGVINSMLGSNETIDNLSLSLYKKDGWANCFTTINSKRVAWKFSWEQQMDKVEQIKNKTGKVISRDYSELNKFLADQLFNKYNDIMSKEPEDDTDDESIEDFFDEDKPKDSIDLTKVDDFDPENWNE